LGVIAEKGGKYARLMFRLAADFSAYDVHAYADITPVGLNFVVHENGTCVLIDEEARIVVVSNRPGSKAYREVEDPAVSADMRLGIRGSQTVFWQGDKVYSITLKQP
jgi:hypothetical protein